MTWFEAPVGRFPLLLYLGSILSLALVFAAGLVAETASSGMRSPLLWIVGLLSLFPVSSLAIALVNLFTTRLVAPHPLPRMDFSKGIPPESSTLVVVPTMLTSPEHIGHLADALEVRFLANRDDNLRFGLLTDFRDAPEEKPTGDEALLLLARQSHRGVERTNTAARPAISFSCFTAPVNGTGRSKPGWATRGSGGSSRN